MESWRTQMVVAALEHLHATDVFQLVTVRQVEANTTGQYIWRIGADCGGWGPVSRDPGARDLSYYEGREPDC